MDWRRLQVFKSIAIFKSFTEASKELKKSQSTLSRDIIYLEKNIGYKVFKRDIRGIQLTEKGTRLFAIAQEFHGKLESVE